MLSATLFAVGLFVFVLVAGNALRDIVGLLAAGRLDWGMFAFLIVVLIPGVVPYALPLGMLTAILLVLGRMSAQGEILAMKAAGLSLPRIAAPIFLLAVLGTLLAAGISFYYAPLAHTTFRETVFNAVRDDPTRFIEPRTFIRDFPGLVIFMEGQDGDTLQNFHIWELDEHGKTRRFVRAESGFFRYLPEEQAMLLTLQRGTGEQRPSSDPEALRENLPVGVFEELQLRLSLSEILGARQFHRKLSLHTLQELVALRRESLSQQLEAETLEQGFTQRIAVQYAIQHKLAFSFGVLSLAILAIPLGIKVGRSETHANLAVALALAMVYFVFTVFISWLETSPHLRPDLLIWLPNFLFQGIGWTLFLRACR